jgi:hypothetical protein
MSYEEEEDTCMSYEEEEDTCRNLRACMAVESSFFE